MARCGAGRSGGTASRSWRAGAEPVTVRRSLPGDAADGESRYIEAAVQGVLIGCLYLPNGNPQPGPKFDYKNAWFGAVGGAWRRAAGGRGAGGVGGGLQRGPDGRGHLRDAVVSRRTRCCSRSRGRPSGKCWRRGGSMPWRASAAMTRRIRSGATSGSRWARDAGLRLDHCLVSPALLPRLRGAGVDRWVRGLDGASDHAPAWVSIERGELE